MRTAREREPCLRAQREAVRFGQRVETSNQKFNCEVLDHEGGYFNSTLGSKRLKENHSTQP